MKLSGAQYKQLQEALLSAFPDQADLEQMVSFELNQNLNAIAGGRTLSAVVFNLISWAEARGRTQDLIDGALTANSGNPALKAFAEGFGPSHDDSPVKPAAGHSPQSGDQVGGDKTTVGNISDASGVAIGQGAKVNITHNYYGQSTTDPQQSVTNDQPPATSNQSPQLFISYAWGGDSEAIVDQLDAAFTAKGISIVRDKRAVNYRDLIRDFMRRLGQGNCVIVIIGKKYLTSENCMFELIEISKQGEFKDRIFPIVLADAEIYNPIERIQYIKHWEEQIKELDEAIRSVSAANLQGFRESIDLYTEIRNTIAGLLDILTDMNALTPEIHQNSNFSQLIEAVAAKLGQV